MLCLIPSTWLTQPAHSLLAAVALLLCWGLCSCQVGDTSKSGGDSGSSFDPTFDPGAERAAADALLDDWHQAASEPDGPRYFASFTEDAIFMGTDATERWTVPEFRAYAEPHFSKGRGWTYLPKDRFMSFSNDGLTAWFDERLLNDKYGELRGTGVLQKEKGAWRIAHYSMVFTIPNGCSGPVVESIRAYLDKSAE